MTIDNRPQWVDLIVDGEVIHSALSEFVFDYWGNIVNADELHWTMTAYRSGPFQVRCVGTTMDLTINARAIPKGHHLNILPGDLTITPNNNAKKATS